MKKIEIKKKEIFKAKPKEKKTCEPVKETKIIISTLDIAFGNEDMNKLVEKINEVINKVND